METEIILILLMVCEVLVAKWFYVRRNLPSPKSINFQEQDRNCNIFSLDSIKVTLVSNL